MRQRYSNVRQMGVQRFLYPARRDDAALGPMENRAGPAWSRFEMPGVDALFLVASRVEDLVENLVENLGLGARTIRTEGTPV